jgi:hypothetical protein
MLLDYEPASLGKHVDEIRDQLGILEATSVPDTDEPAGARSPDLVDEVNTSERASPIPLSAFGSSLKSSVLGTTMTSSTSSSSVTSEDEPQTEQELLGGFFPSL